MNTVEVEFFPDDEAYAVLGDSCIKKCIITYVNISIVSGDVDPVIVTTYTVLHSDNKTNILGEDVLFETFDLAVDYVETQIT